MASATPDTRPGYGRLLRTPGAWTFLLPGFLARQPFAMLTIGILLLVQHTTGSYGSAGAVSATTGVAMALAAPWNGRLADRFGQRATLIPSVLVHVASGTGLAVLALSGAPFWVLLAVAVPTGASVPQVGPMVRARWGVRLEDPRLVPTAAAFESVTDEFTFVVGPVLATAVATGVHPAAGLLAEAALTLVGGLLFALQKGGQPPRRRADAANGGIHAASALSVPGVRLLAVAFLGVGTVFGGMQVSLTALTEAMGRPGVNGLLYGVFAAGNMLSGLVCGAVAWKAGPQRRLLLAYAWMTAALAPLWALHSLPAIAVVGWVVGLGLAPALVTGYSLVNDLVPASSRTEAFTWLTGSVALGQAAAATVAGRLADALGASTGFLVPLGGTLLALLVLTLWRRHLRPATPARVVAGGRPGTTADLPAAAATGTPDTGGAASDRR